MPGVDESPVPERRLFCVYCGGNVTRVEERDQPRAQETLRFQCNNPKCAALFFGSKANPILGLQGPEAEAVQKVAAGIVYELYFRQMAAQASDRQLDGEPTTTEAASTPETETPDLGLDDDTDLIDGEPTTTEAASTPETETPDLGLDDNTDLIDGEPTTTEAASTPETETPDLGLDEATDLMSGCIRVARFFFDLAGKGPKKISWWEKVRFTISMLVLFTLRVLLRVIGFKENRKAVIRALITIFFTVPFALGVYAMLTAFDLSLRLDPEAESSSWFIYWSGGAALLWISVGAFYLEGKSRRKAVRMVLIETCVIGLLAWLICFAVVVWTTITDRSHLISLSEVLKRSWILHSLAGAFLVVLTLAFFLRPKRASAPK
jgi:hypothetical protein